MAIWDAQHETMDRERLEALQLERLRADARARLRQGPVLPLGARRRGVRARRPHGLDDLGRLPFTEKNDFRDAYPYGLFAVPLDEVVEIHSSSGTTGKAVVGGYTRADLDTWTELVCRLAVAVGARPRRRRPGRLRLRHVHRRVRPALRPAEAPAWPCVPISAGNTSRQIKLMQDFGTTILIATPSYALYIGEVVAEARRRARGAQAPARHVRRRDLQRGDARAQIEARLPDAWPPTTTASPS